jgi:hypothetical protein
LEHSYIREHQPKILNSLAIIPGEKEASYVKSRIIQAFLLGIAFLVLSTCSINNPAGAQGQGNEICGVVKGEMTSCCGVAPPLAYSCDAFYFYIETCDGESFLLDFNELNDLYSYIDKYVKITNPVFGQVPHHWADNPPVYCEYAYGIVGWSHLEVISSCSHCEDPCNLIYCLPHECRGCDLYTYVGCRNGECIYELTERDSSQCGYGCGDPCVNMVCPPQCFGSDYWAMKCVEGDCIRDYIIEKNSAQCGYDPCENVSCRAICRGEDLWAQKCVDGECVDDELLERKSANCGYDPCESHCSNKKKDCGESGVDCGGGCPLVDSDNDGIEDCRDLCPTSRCDRVDMDGCETDVDGDGVLDCEDRCRNEKGDASNSGCPSSTNVMLILGGIGAAIAAGGGIALWGMKGGKPPGEPRMGQGSRISRPTPQEIAARKEAAEQIAGETAEEVAKKKTGTTMAEAATKEAGTKLAEAATKEAGTKLAEAATKEAGTKLAEAATGAGVAGAVAKSQKESFCPNCGEKLPPDSKFCSTCGNRI